SGAAAGRRWIGRSVRTGPLCPAGRNAVAAGHGAGPHRPVFSGGGCSSMKSSPARSQGRRCFLVRSSLAAVALATLATPVFAPAPLPTLACAPAAPAQLGDVFSWAGTQGFSSLLGLSDLTPLTDIKEVSEHSPKETLIIVFGKPNVLEPIKTEIGGLREFYDK